jgi:hypothetical protein
MALVIVFFFSNVSTIPGSRYFIQLGASEVRGEGIDSYTKLLMHFDGINGSSQFVDSCGNQVSTIGGAQISTSQYKFGGSSGYLNSSSYLSIKDSQNLDISTGNFTIDYWIYPTSNSYGCIMQTYLDQDGSKRAPIFGYMDNGRMLLFLTSNGLNWDIADGVSMGSVENNMWIHYAVARNGNNFYTFKNGILQSAFINSSALSHNTGDMIVGKYLNYPCRSYDYFYGYIDELRISKGIARWTSNFTPPSSPYNLEPNTNVTAPSQNGTLFQNLQMGKRSV